MTTDMTKGPIIPQLTEFTIPLVLGNLFQLTYNAGGFRDRGEIRRGRRSRGGRERRSDHEHGDPLYQRDVHGRRDPDEHPVRGEEI